MTCLNFCTCCAMLIVLIIPQTVCAETTDDYNRLVGKYNRLLTVESENQREYNALVKRYNVLTEKDKRRSKQIKQLQTEYKRLVRTLKLPSCKKAKATLKQCVPEIFNKNNN